MAAPSQPVALLLCALMAANASVSTPARSSSACSLATGCDWDKIPFRCTRPALSATYLDVTRYSGAMACGNLMLESDIGGGLNAPPFVIGAPGAREQEQREEAHRAGGRCAERDSQGVRSLSAHAARTAGHICAAVTQGTCNSRLTQLVE